jgi:uncharacterized protein (DUF488 family)
VSDSSDQSAGETEAAPAPIRRAEAGLDRESQSGRRRVVRKGNGIRVFTIGYEQRTGEECIASLLEAGVDTLVDVRERPFSRKPDFRKAAIERRCRAAGLAYESWTRLGSTGHQRRQLRETRDFSTFARRYRDFARRRRATELHALATLARTKTIALICYERAHEDCHRSIIADLLADRLDATIIAIL